MALVSQRGMVAIFVTENRKEEGERVGCAISSTPHHKGGGITQACEYKEVGFLGAILASANHVFP